jgi:Phosphoenolpyruvate synthase/pyruvate phosphate dikinase
MTTPEGPASTLTDFVSTELYPGYEPGFGHNSYCVEAVRPFQPEDAARFWLLEGHWPRGIVPLGYSCIEDCAWGTQWAAQLLPLPTGKGLSARFAGTHVYNTEIPVTSPWEAERRAALANATFPDRIRNFPQQWEACRDELLLRARHLETAPVDTMDMSALAGYVDEVFSFQRWAWEQHFLFMYPLLANYFGLRALCEQLGVDTALVSKFLQGNDTKIMETDRQLWALADLAREHGIAHLFVAGDDETMARLRATPQAANWLAALSQFLDTYGWRTDGMADPDLAPWIEDPRPVLNLVATFLGGERHDFAAAAAAAVAEREQAIETARASLTTREWAEFEPVLRGCQHANFPWWNEEHDFYIDLRVHIPVRRAALALGRLVGAARPDDCLYLFKSELEDIVRGRRSYAEFADVIPQRRSFRELWAAQRARMPKMLGNVPDDVTDPVMKEIFGLRREFLQAVRDGVSAPELGGVAASSGSYTGRVRVLRHASEIGSLQAGEVLVCEFTSPNWTPAFARIGACVTDQGGVLSHTAIVSREYRVPCVTGVGIATNVLRDGDLVEVDGTAGRVRILERARVEELV